MQKFPDWEGFSTCLVRNKERGALLRASHPKVKLAYGDLSNSALLEREAAAADIVIHCASITDVDASISLAKGLARRTRAGSAFWISLSGTDNLAWPTLETGNYGETLDTVWDDYDGLSKVASFPDDAPHRDVEKIQLEAGSDNVKVAIVCAPTVYGPGRSCGNKRSDQVPGLAKYTIQNGKSFIVGRGLNRWPNIHIHDLSSLILILVTNAADGGRGATWNEHGYYFAENGEHVWKDIAEQIAKEAKSQGLIQKSNVVSYSAEEVDRQVEWGALIYGTDSRCKAIRARRILGWKPVGHTLEQEIGRAVEEEASQLKA